MDIIKKQKNKSIQISFIDEYASENVTGSMVYIKTPNHKLLLDAGFVQSNDIETDYKRNTRSMKKFKIKEIDYLFLTHTHGDHIFLAPYLYKQGCTAKTMIPKDSINILKIMLENCAGINERDARYLTKRNKKRFNPIFDNDDIEYFLKYVEEYPIGYMIKIDEELSFKWIPSGHLLKGCQLELYITIGNHTKKILYTSDLGNPKLRQCFTESFEPIEKANYVIAESTYGDKSDLKIRKKERELEMKYLKELILSQVVDKQGKLLIPSFSQSRTQSISYLIYEIFKNQDIKFDIYIDSPLSIKLFDAMKDILTDGELLKLKELLKWKHLKFISSIEESFALMKSQKPCIIISSSGMCNHGRVKEHLKYILPNFNASILFIGYAGEGTTADKIQKNKIVEIDKQSYEINCNVYTLKTMSSHMPFKELVEYYSSIHCEKIFLHHGSKIATKTLKETLEKKFIEDCKTTAVVAVNHDTIFEIS